jgi:8-amino-7-oxononanoate synthase
MGTDPRPSLDHALGEALAGRDAASLLRRLRRVEARHGVRVVAEGRALLNFSSNDYLGLASHPALIEVTAAAARQWGAGSAASRLVCGSLAVHHQLEEAIAEWQQVPAALAFSSGFAAASGVIPAVVGPGDLILFDRLSHACCIDAARASGADCRPFRHNDTQHLADLLQRADASGRNRRRRILIITESIFSMDGDAAPLAEIVALKQQHGAWLLLDEAHASGLHGSRRSGLAEALHLGASVDIHMGTLGKAVGASGGFIAGSRPLIDWLINAARSFVFSTAPTPAAAAAATEGIRILQSEEGAQRARTALARTRQLADLLPCPRETPEPAAAILPWVLGNESTSLDVAQHLLEKGFLAPAIRYPTVPKGRARIRFTLSADHTVEEVDALGIALATLPTQNFGRSTKGRDAAHEHNGEQ